jgi:hypothetical protein
VASPDVQRFPVNSAASNVVIGLALVPGIAALCAAFYYFEHKQILLGAAAGVGFLVILMPAGLLARRLGKEIEVSDDGIREIDRAGRVVAIRWDEPHQLTHKTTTVRRIGVPMMRVTQVTIVAAGRKIAFSAQRGGAVGAAAQLSGNTAMTAASDAVDRVIALSAKHL